MVNTVERKTISRQGEVNQTKKQPIEDWLTSSRLAQNNNQTFDVIEHVFRPTATWMFCENIADDNLFTKTTTVSDSKLL